jgi:hypothetical protein
MPLLEVNSNGKESRDLVVIFETTHAIISHCARQLLMEALRDFVLSRLPRHHPAVFEYSSYGGMDQHREYQYNVVCGTGIRTNFAPDDTSTLTHRVVIAIHLKRDSLICGAPSLRIVQNDHALVDDRHLASNNRPPLPADTVARCLAANHCGKPWLARTLQSKWPGLSSDMLDVIVRHLDCYPDLVQHNVRTIGVSAVPPTTMTLFWHDILHSRRDGDCDFEYSHHGLGRGRHPMHRLEEAEDIDDALFCVDWSHELANENHFSTTKEEAIEATENEPGAFAWDQTTDRSRKFTGKAWLDAQKRPLGVHALHL